VTTATKVFAARVAGLPVIGPDGEPVGKVRDIAVTGRTTRRPPRVLGLVVELATRRRIFVPQLRITAIEPQAVLLGTGTVNLSRFHQRPHETLVMAELLDARVTIDATGAAAVVVDVGLEQERRDYLATKIAVRVRTGRFSRRGPVQVLGWHEVTGLTEPERSAGQQGAEQLLAQYESVRAADLADILRELPVKRRNEVVDALDDERLADVFEELPEREQTELLARLNPERAADVLEAMNPDDAADLLAELTEPQRERLLSLMEPTESAGVKRLLQHAPDTAGGLMTNEPIVLAHDDTVAKALAMVRNPDLTPALASMVFVTRPPQATPTGRYLGCVHAQRLLREAPFDLVSGIVDADLARLAPEAPLSEVTRYFAAYNLVCAPVVDSDNHLLGAVTVDDVLDHLLPEDWRTTRLPADRTADERVVRERLAEDPDPDQTQPVSTAEVLAAEPGEPEPSRPERSEVHRG
jgi:CBS domain-containing protein